MKLAIITLIIIATVAYSQPEIEGQRHYGDDHYDYFTSHIRCEDGGWAFCGAHHDNGEQEDFWLVRTDMEGEIRYQALYGDGNKEWAYDLAETEDGGFVIGGYVYTPPTSSYFIVRVDNNGEEVWSRTYGEFESDQCRAVLGIKNDRFLLAGYAENGENNREGYLVKIEGNGDVIWERTYGGELDDVFWDIIRVENGFALCGTSRSFNGDDSDFWLLRINEDGEEVMSQVYGNDADENIRALIQTADGGFALTGHEVGENNLRHGMVVKTNGNGNQQWIQRYRHDEFRSRLRDLVQMADGGYAVAGRATIPGSPHMGYTLRLNPGGNVVWERLDAFDVELESGLNMFDSVILDDDGGITCAGTCSLPPEWGNLPNYEGWFQKLAPANRPPIILSKTPEDSLFRIIRNVDQIFTVNAIDPELDDLIYRWEIEGDTFSVEDTVIFNFQEYDTLNVQVHISDLTFWVSTGWHVMVVPLITDWSPVDTVLAIEPNRSIDFEVTSGLLEDVTYSWTFMDEEVSDADTARVLFPDAGEFIVRAEVTSRDITESRPWHVTVRPLEAPSLDLNPTQFNLSPPSPNPFNSTTKIKYSLPVASPVSIKLYNISGALVSSLINSQKPTGIHTTTLTSNTIPAGLYIIQMTTPTFSTMRKVILVK